MIVVVLLGVIVVLGLLVLVASLSSSSASLRLFPRFGQLLLRLLEASSCALDGFLAGVLLLVRCEQRIALVSIGSCPV